MAEGKIKPSEIIRMHKILEDLFDESSDDICDDGSLAMHVLGADIAIAVIKSVPYDFETAAKFLHAIKEALSAIGLHDPEEIDENFPGLTERIYSTIADGTFEIEIALPEDVYEIGKIEVRVHNPKAKDKEISVVLSEGEVTYKRVSATKDPKDIYDLLHPATLNMQKCTRKKKVKKPMPK